MTDDEFNAFVERATNEVKGKQKSLTEVYGLGHHKNFSFDQTTGILQFKNAKDIVLVEASVTPIGSLSLKSDTWQWAWANETVVEPQRSKAERLKELGSLTGMAVFQTAIFQADEPIAWELAAIAVCHLHSLGCYRIPAKQLQVFLAIDSIRSMPYDALPENA